MSFNSILIFVFVLLIAEVSSASTEAWDTIYSLSGPRGKSRAECLAQLGNPLFVASAFNYTTGDVNHEACETLSIAKAGGFPQVDAYMAPCTTCKISAAEQLDKLVSALSAHCSWSKRLWLYLLPNVSENPSWVGTVPENQAFFKELVDACLGHNITCGIHSAEDSWTIAFGKSFVYGNQLPLWWSLNDQVASFDHWEPFGGWSTPYMKQTTIGSQVLRCGLNVNINYLPQL